MKALKELKEGKRETAWRTKQRFLLDGIWSWQLLHFNIWLTRGRWEQTTYTGSEAGGDSSIHWINTSYKPIEFRVTCARCTCRTSMSKVNFPINPLVNKSSKKAFVCTAFWAISLCSIAERIYFFVPRSTSKPLHYQTSFPTTPWGNDAWRRGYKMQTFIDVRGKVFVLRVLETGAQCTAEMRMS